MTERPSLLVVAHGFLYQDERTHPAKAHVRRLRTTDAFADVAAGFVNDDPSVEAQVQSLESDRLVVVPLFVSGGYFVGTIPDHVESACSDDVTVEYTRPVGTHERMTEVIMRRVLAAVDEDAESVGVALFGHGSEHTTQNSETIREHARRIRDSGPFAEVRSYFVEEEPTGEQLPKEFDAEQVVAVPVFVARGTHVREDIPEAVGFSGRGGTVDGTAITYTVPVGADPLVASIVFDRGSSLLDESGKKQMATPTVSGQRRQEQ